MATLTGNDREYGLLDTFVQLADTMVDDYDIAEVLHELVMCCVQFLDAAAAGLVLSDERGSVQLLASSTEQTRMLELYQIQTDEGPCLECVHTGRPVLIANLASEVERWPLFVPRALDEGFASVHAVPLRLRQQTIGALNLFGDKPIPMSEQDIRVARALADTATIGILQERAIRRGEVLTEQLQAALNARIVIEQAKGVLAHAGNLDMDEAFQALRGYGRQHSARLSEIAHQLVTGLIHPRMILTK
ncbi:GAF and ANTAR domain-containing protein [Nocardia sp. NPDC060256]|uniref:GAF and ANTAR domain-containing protein n=1 Tax=unclassified Nocardia TaxID=2637762 RepID=UPI00364FE05F